MQRLRRGLPGRGRPVRLRRHAVGRHQTGEQGRCIGFKSALFWAGETACRLERPAMAHQPELSMRPLVMFRKNQILTRQGEYGDRAWLIESGHVAIFVNGEMITTIGEGAMIGEMSLIDGGLRTATTKAITEVTAHEIQRRDFQRLIDQCEPLAGYLLESLSDTIRHALGLPQVLVHDPDPRIQAKRWPSGLLETCRYETGSTLYEAGETATVAYLIRSGLVTIRRDFVEIVHHGPGRVIGEICLLENAPRTATALAVEPTECELIRRGQFEEAIATMPPVLKQLTVTYLKRISALSANSG
jgi:CRP-like cAMP-binding protein